MQFKHPEILYALFLLLVPILVHLFQLRKFKKEYFTNVKLLKELQTQTRKSSKIKKWLLLATRLLLLAALILAFAQPFFEAKDKNSASNELIILLDNSFSMQAKGAKGELFKRNIQEILEDMPQNQTFSLLTTTEVFWDTDVKSIQKELQNLSYSATAFNLEFLINQVENRKKYSKKDFIVITDAIQTENPNFEKIVAKHQVYFMQQKAENKSNCSVSKVEISQVLEQFYELKISIDAFGKSMEELPLSVFNGEKAVAKAIAKFKDNKATLTITIPKKEFHGKISIEDGSLPYDNAYFISISKPEKSKIIAIENPESNQFLDRIFVPEEFEYQSVALQSLNYNAIENQDVVVLNELENLPVALGTTLKSFYEKGGVVVLIPNLASKTENLNAFAKNFGGLFYQEVTNTEKQITKINFSHPLYQSVFEKEVSNFQYPKTNASFALQKGTPVLQYADQAVFLGSVSNRIGSFYAFSAPINKQNSNFQNAPLIVPTFYKMGQNQFKSGINAYTIGKNETLIVDAILNKYKMLSIKKEKYSFIPMQQFFNTKCKLTFGDFPEQAGNFAISNETEVLKNISFNYDRTESDLSLVNTASYDDFTKIDSIEAVLNTIASSRSSSELWKLFIYTTLFFLFLELMIQKFVK